MSRYVTKYTKAALLLCRGCIPPTGILKVRYLSGCVLQNRLISGKLHILIILYCMHWSLYENVPNLHSETSSESERDWDCFSVTTCAWLRDFSTANILKFVWVPVEWHQKLFMILYRKNAWTVGLLLPMVAKIKANQTATFQIPKTFLLNLLTAPKLWMRSNNSTKTCPVELCWF